MSKLTNEKDSLLNSAFPDKPSHITIITVVYNMGEYLEQTIQSVMNLKSDLVKYIIIDGGSTDNTTSVIKSYDAYIDFWVSEPDAGIFDAMNKGWSVANNDSYILFLGAGDKIISLPKVSSLKKNQVVFGKVLFDNGVIFNATADFRLKIGSTVHHQALLIHKSLHIQPPFDIKFETYADFDFNQRLLKKKVEFIFSNELLSYALPHGNSGKFQTIESLKIINKNFGLLFASLAIVYYTIQKIKKFT